MTGPITFSHAKARSYLLENGFVFSFRADDRTTGDTWLRFSRLGPKRGDVTVEKIASAHVDPGVLVEYAEYSGFESVDAWIDAIDELGDVDQGFVYRVTLDDAVAVEYEVGVRERYDTDEYRHVTVEATSPEHAGEKALERVGRRFDDAVAYEACDLTGPRTYSL